MGAVDIRVVLDPGDIQRLNYDLEADSFRLGEEAMEVLADLTLEEAGRYWPVDTGRSRSGLSNRVAFYRINWENLYDYAYWVEKRWFPLARFFRGRLTSLVQRARLILRQRQRRG